MDLGGTNCRVFSVDLHGDSTYTLQQSRQAIPRHLMVNSSHKPLFNFVAEEIKRFLGQYHKDAFPNSATSGSRQLKLGFTFSFTYENTSLSHGTMLQWDKGWDIVDALGRDPCEMLQSAINELALPVRVSALVSDSVGTLVSRAYTSPANSETLIGAIFGTGTNAAYVERLSNVHKLQNCSEYCGQDEIMVINTEWGAFDEEMVVLPSNSIDETLDAASSNPGRQMLEKRISGMYLGELLRLAVVALKDQGVSHMVVDETSPLRVAYGIDSSVLTLLAQDDDDLAKSKQRCLETLKVQRISEEDMQALRILARAIARRSARLAAAALAAAMLQSGKLSTTASSSVSSGASTEKTKKHRRVSGEVRLGIFCKAFSLLGRIVSKLVGRKKMRGPRSQIHQPAQELLLDIGVDGSLFELYPSFREDIRQTFREIPEIGPEGLSRITMEVAKDGSGVGAALVALMADKE